MQIKAIQVQNLRSIRSGHLTLEPLTALIGGNNAGKSTILKAIDLFFDSAPKLDIEDFSIGSDADSIEITITFEKLTPIETAEFGTAVINNELIVTRHLSLTDKDSGQYSAQAMVFPGFDTLRAESNGTRRRSLYNTLRTEFQDLEPISTHTEIEGKLSAWEKANSQRCNLQKIRGFFGAPNVANGKLRKKTGVHLIPAVRDAATDATDSRRSPIIALLSEVSKQTFENRTEVSEFIQRAQGEFNTIADPSRIPELSQISDLLTQSIQKFYSDSKLTAQWDAGEGLRVSFPSPRLVVENAGTVTQLAKVGHGLQRAALFSIVQFLAEQASPNETIGQETAFSNAASDIIILIEEPEIYQHPNKQLVIYEAFKKIAANHNTKTGIRVQIIYTTHSEKFIRMENFNAARIVRRPTDKDDLQTHVAGITIKRCSEAFAAFREPPASPMSDEAFAAKLHIFTREVCEGFFSQKIILVEGGTDRAVLEAAYNVRGRNIHREGISIISADGKTKMDKPAYIFKQLGIPTYLVFDNDQYKPEKQKKPQTNILLQKICGFDKPTEWPCGAHEAFAATQGDLETYLQTELGDLYDEFFNSVAEEYGLSFDEIKKTPAATAIVFSRANERGKSLELFDKIISRVDEL